MPYSLAEAAAAVGMNKTTVLRAIKAGKLSGTKDEHGQWFIEPAELHRLYPPVADAAPDVELRIALAAAERELAVLKDMVTDLRTQRDDMRAQREDMQAQRDVWQAEAQRLALPAPRESEAAAPKPATRPVVIEMSSSGRGVAPAEAIPVTRPALTRKQRMLKFWFGREYRRRAG